MSRQGQFRSRTYKNVKDFWESEAQDWGKSPQVTIRDFFFRNHELNILLSIIPQTNNLLDVGCGNGFGTLILSQKANYTLGIDYSETLIKWANHAKNNKSYRLKETRKFLLNQYYGIHFPNKTDFNVGDLLNLSLNNIKFDIIMGQRILINLPTEELQMKALRNLRKYIQKEGLLIFTEATRQGHEITDNYRERFGLPILEKYWHNNYVDEDFKKWRENGWEVVQVLSFDVYALLSKVIYPAALGPNNCTFLSGTNRAAYEIANIFRTKKAADEIGIDKLLNMFIEHVLRYDEIEAQQISMWVKDNGKKLDRWDKLGHQKLIIAKPI